MARWGQGLTILALCVVAAGWALARGRDVQTPEISPGVGNFGGGWYSEPAQGRADWSGDEERRPAKRKQASARGSGARAVCVRLCDGSFFPAASSGAGDAGCAAQCPGAPTELYAMTSDKIDDAVSMSSGAPYTRLPVAKRYQTSRDNSCACRRDVVASRAKELLSDPTLRRGDVVMTAEGFRVYQGSGWGETTAKDFVSVAKAGLSREQSAQLSAMEHASAVRVAPASPAMVALRPKGNVTVDDGTR